MRITPNGHRCGRVWQRVRHGLYASDDFPLASPIDDTLGSHAVDDVFVTKFNPSGSGLVYSTYLGGASGDDAYAIALDQAGNAYITGRTNSSDFPLVNPIQLTRVAFDMFVTEINSAGSALLFSTFLGGSASESGRGIAVDSLGNIHIAGESTSTDFPTLNAVQMTSGGAQDGIVLLFATRLPHSYRRLRRRRQDRPRRLSPVHRHLVRACSRAPTTRPTSRSSGA